MGNRVLCLALALLLWGILPCVAQDFSVSTNLVGYADYGTMNMEASMALSRHWSLNAGARYNPFTFKGGKGGEGLQNRQRCFSLGTRFWPWHIYSGWWLSGKLQWQEYNRGGIKSLATEEGTRYGAGLTAGYTYMLSEHFNLEVGVGGWMGLQDFKKYSCPTCGTVLDEGNKYFTLLNDVLLSFSYIF